MYIYIYMHMYIFLSLILISDTKYFDIPHCISILNLQQGLYHFLLPNKIYSCLSLLCEGLFSTEIKAFHLSLGSTVNITLNFLLSYPSSCYQYKKPCLSAVTLACFFLGSRPHLMLHTQKMISFRVCLFVSFKFMQDILFFSYISNSMTDQSTSFFFSEQRHMIASFCCITLSNIKLSVEVLVGSTTSQRFCYPPRCSVYPKSPLHNVCSYMHVISSSRTPQVLKFPDTQRASLSFPLRLSTSMVIPYSFISLNLISFQKLLIQ